MKTWILPLLVLVSCVGQASSVGAASPGDDVPIDKFSEVSPEIYRGARPDAAGLLALVRLGVKVDLDLENDSKAVTQETSVAASMGIKVISKPMSGFWSPDDKEVAEIEAILDDSENYPIFVHCEHGEDRTGLIIGLYRVFHQGWKPATAYAEMKEDGFHSELFFLNHYFEKKTGFED